MKDSPERRCPKMANNTLYQKMRQSNHGGEHAISCHGACCLRGTDLGLRMGDDTVFEHVDLHIHCGEIVALIGPNGAGKSSLLKAILGQYPHTGKLEFYLASGDKAQPTFGYVPQNPAFDRNDPISVLDLFASCISRWPVFLPIPRALRARVRECLARVHAEKLIDRRLGALSGGELQRVLLALALEPVPHILILDEPMSGVDIDGMKLLLDMLDEIRRNYDLSILMSTHDFTMLDPYVDRVLLLNDTIQAAGPPREVLNSEAFRSAFHLGQEWRV